MRDVTERIEGIEVGTALLVRTRKETIESEVLKLLNSKDYYKNMTHLNNPYGDGKTSEKIFNEIC
jgi:UDP-N-acetylglucosamine 2-epimerase (non-hydrolysing)